MKTGGTWILRYDIIFVIPTFFRLIHVIVTHTHENYCMKILQLWLFIIHYSKCVHYIFARILTYAHWWMVNFIDNMQYFSMAEVIHHAVVHGELIIFFRSVTSHEVTARKVELWLTDWCEIWRAIVRNSNFDPGYSQYDYYYAHEII